MESERLHQDNSVLETYSAGGLVGPPHAIRVVAVSLPNTTDTGPRRRSYCKRQRRPKLREHVAIDGRLHTQVVQLLPRQLYHRLFSDIGLPERMSATQNGTRLLRCIGARFIGYFKSWESLAHKFL